jgi:hypothetical protein
MDWRISLVQVSQHHPDREMAAPQQDSPTEVINLLGWHRGLHMITGSMALRFNTATAEDLANWAGMLREIATEMEAERDA